ncbi:MAG TPA: response regulator transcription factor [Ignavibacteriaceae bacterium]|nr:response regulator transcription factor [Ignavibacteriaceae bacterium]
MKKIKLLLIEDDTLLRKGIIAMLKKQNDVEIIASSGNNENSAIKLKQLKPDIILLDLGLRNMNSLTAVEFVKRDFPNAKVILLDLAPSRKDLKQFVIAGASGFIFKDATLYDLLEAIHSDTQSVNVFPANLSKPIFPKVADLRLKRININLNKTAPITKRELQVIGFIGEGLSIKGICEKLNITNFTVKSHIQNIMGKLAFHTQLEETNYSNQSGTFKKIIKDISLTNRKLLNHFTRKGIYI